MELPSEGPSVTTPSEVQDAPRDALGASILAALETERQAAQQPTIFSVVAARRVGPNVVMEVGPARTGRASEALDEGLESANGVWSDGAGRGAVVMVDPEAGELVFHYVQGELPPPGAVIRLYQRDFLTPLIDLWRDPQRRQRALRVRLRKGAEPFKPDNPLKHPAFSDLRQRQEEAVRAALYPAALIHGPPGTGKTFTIGALAANLLQRFSNARVLLTGPTNVAVDSALEAVDDWLLRIERSNLRPTMKRIGSRFDIKRYTDRQHLLAPGLYEASVAVEMLEAEEPDRKDLEKYVRWKEALLAARAKLQTDVEAVADGSRLLAMTTASLFQYFSVISKNPWSFVIADEASQIPMPAALMLGSLASNSVIYAGDPRQLAPIVQANEARAQKLLGSTAFDWMKGARGVFLNEQSRMAQGICDVVSTTFYEGALKVSPKALQEAAWNEERQPWFLNGREVPRVMVDDRGGAADWSSKYGGKIRYHSAKIVQALVDELLGSYARAEDILVLTPFRSQRALLRGMLRHGGGRDVRVSTVHRSQGSERKIIIFDPVDAATPFLNSETGRRLINVAASRAQAHLLMVIGQDDLKNPHMLKMHQRARRLWDRPDEYGTPLRVRVRSDRMADI